MALSFAEPTATNPQKLYPLIGQNYQLALNRSIEKLLAEIRKESPNLSPFTQSFYELMQARTDPPFESIWVYSALNSRSRNFTEEDLLAQISVVKDLFQSISACSAPSSSSNSIALLAPVLLEVHRLVVKVIGKGMGSKKNKKVMGKVHSFIDVLVGYISVCCCDDSNEESDLDLNCSTPFADLVRVWRDGNGDVESFLPLVSDGIRRGVVMGGCDVAFLAGVVIVEAFLLKLCLLIHDGSAKDELDRSIRSWAVAAITGFQNIYFYEIVVRMMVETSWAVTSLLDSEEVCLLKKFLYDALVPVEYSFLHSGKASQLPAERMKKLAITRLIVTLEAIEFSRKSGDHQRAISYADAFSNSRLPSEIMKWVANQIGMEEKASQSPKPLLKWLLNLEDRGLSIFNDNILRSRAKQAIDISKEELGMNVEDQKIDADALFYIDNKGVDGGNEDYKTESLGAAFIDAAHTMGSTEKEGKKRKKGKDGEKKKQIKFIKYEIDESKSARPNSTLISEDDSNSESQVEDPEDSD